MKRGDFMPKKEMKQSGNVCPYCGKTDCKCRNVMKVVTFVIGIIFL